MAHSGTIEDEWTLNSPADDVHTIYWRACYLFPKIPNSRIRKVELVSGNSWVSPSSKRRWTFDKGNCGTWVDTMEDIYEQTRSITFTLLSGEALDKHYNYMKLVHQFTDKEGGCTAKVRLEFGKKDTNANPNDYLPVIGDMLKAVDDYLQGTYNQA